MSCGNVWVSYDPCHFFILVSYVYYLYHLSIRFFHLLFSQCKFSPIYFLYFIVEDDGAKKRLKPSSSCDSDSIAQAEVGLIQPRQGL